MGTYWFEYYSCVSSLIISATKDPSSLLESLVKLCVYSYNLFFFMMADDEGIPANFLEEDNDLPEDEHLPEDEPVRKRRLLFYTLEQKKKIVHEGHSQPRHV
jgi:hypothetical protein